VSDINRAQGPCLKGRFDAARFNTVSVITRPSPLHRCLRGRALASDGPHASIVWPRVFKPVVYLWSSGINGTQRDASLCAWPHRR
jgi:hypothetical protein